MHYMDYKNVGQIDGFDITFVIDVDYDTTPEEFDCYTPKQVAAWKNNEWQYVTIGVLVARCDIELGSAFISGVEYGEFPITTVNDEVTETAWLDVVEVFENAKQDGTFDDLVSDAIAGANLTIAQLAVPVGKVA